MFWILFENVMSLHRTKATFIGLLEVGKVNEWVVTEKLGDALKTRLGAKAPRKPRFRFGERYYFVWISFIMCSESLEKSNDWIPIVIAYKIWSMSNSLHHNNEFCVRIKKVNPMGGVQKNIFRCLFNWGPLQVEMWNYRCRALRFFSVEFC